MRRDETPAQPPASSPEAPEPVHVTSVLPAIDVLIAQFTGRELVSGAEFVDVLLDLRLLAEADELVAARS